MAGKKERYSEFELIQKIRTTVESLSRTSEGENRLVRGIGDDCALLPAGQKEDLLFTKDLLVEDIHFSLATHTLEEAGRKSVYVNVSDVFAMGGAPRYALVGLAAPKRLGKDEMDAFQKGVLEAAAEFGVRLIGGDTVASPDKMVISVTLIGSVPTGKAVFRSGARAGDLIAVNGPLGESAAGLLALTRGTAGYDALKERHKLPRPRPLPESVRANVTAMIDLSDGLSGDLLHICEESDVSACLNEESIPRGEDLKSFCAAVNLDPLELALHGGEDFCLLFTVDPSSRKKAEAEGMFIIGEIRSLDEARPRITLKKRSGEEQPLEIKSWDHFA